MLQCQLKFLLKHIFQSCDKGLMSLVSQEWKKAKYFPEKLSGTSNKPLVKQNLVRV